MLCLLRDTTTCIDTTSLRHQMMVMTRCCHVAYELMIKGDPRVSGTLGSLCVLVFLNSCVCIVWVRVHGCGCMCAGACVRVHVEQTYTLLWGAYDS